MRENPVFLMPLPDRSCPLLQRLWGTTTDPVRKSMEILPLGPVLLIDTRVLMMRGSVGSMRVERTKEVLRETDIALLFLPAKDFLSAKDVLPARKEEQGEGFFLSDIEGQEEVLFLPEKEASYLRLFRKIRFLHSSY